MARNHLGSAGDDDLVHVATDQHLLVPIGRRHRVVVQPIAHQRERVDSARFLVASIVESWQRLLEGGKIALQPLADWKLPEEFATLRRLLEARMGKSGKREFVQVLRLMEVFKIDDVAAAVRDAIARGAVGFDAVKHLVLCRIERRPPRLDMTIYPYLPKATVATTSARSYMDLLAGVAA